MSQAVIQPDAAAGWDTYLSSLATSTNYGIDSVLRAGPGRISKFSGFYRILLRFSTSAIPPGATVNAATLTLFHSGSALSGGGTFHLYRVTRSDWTEAGVTWSNWGAGAWTTPGGDYTTSSPSGDSVAITGISEDLVFGNVAALVVDAIANR